MADVFPVTAADRKVLSTKLWKILLGPLKGKEKTRFPGDLIELERLMVMPTFSKEKPKQFWPPKASILKTKFHASYNLGYSSMAFKKAD